VWRCTTLLSTKSIQRFYGHLTAIIKINKTCIIQVCTHKTLETFPNRIPMAHLYYNLCTSGYAHGTAFYSLHKLLVSVQVSVYWLENIVWSIKYYRYISNFPSFSQYIRILYKILSVFCRTVTKITCNSTSHIKTNYIYTLKHEVKSVI